jgi:hypothetical protein
LEQPATDATAKPKKTRCKNCFITPIRKSREYEYSKGLNQPVKISRAQRGTYRRVWLVYL